MPESKFHPEQLTCLVVDDHDPMRKGIRRVLSSMGFGQVVECFDGEDAIAYLKEKPADLIVCDLYMRKKSGFEVIEYVRGRGVATDTPIILVTGEGSKDEIVKAVDRGANDYVLKPFQPDDLERKITTVLNRFFAPSRLNEALREAERFFIKGQHQAALKRFEECVKINGDSVRAAHGKAMSLHRLGDPSEAVKVLKAAIKKNHTYYPNYGALADIYLETGDIKSGIAAMRRELEINPKQPSRQVQFANVLLKHGDSIGAIDHFRAALRDHPNRLGALLGMGRAYARAENLDKSFYYLKRIRRYHGKATKGLELAVKIALAADEPRRADLLLRDEKRAHPERLDTYIVLAKLYVQLDRPEDALEVLEELLAKKEDHPEGLLLKGLVLVRNRKFEAALPLLEQAKEKTPVMEVLLALSECHLELSNIGSAVDQLHQCLAKDRRHPQTLFLLAEAAFRSHQFLKAHTLYYRAAMAGGPAEICQDKAKDSIQKRKLRLAGTGSPPAKVS